MDKKYQQSSTMKFKTFNALVIVSIVVPAVFSLYVYNQYVTKQMHDVIINTIRQTVHKLTLQVDNYLNNRVEGSLEQILKRTNSSSKEIKGLYLFDNLGNVIIKVDESSQNQHLLPSSRSIAADMLNVKNITGISQVYTKIYKKRGSVLIPYTLYATLDHQYIQKSINQIKYIQFFVSLLLIALFATTYYFFYRLVLKPLLLLDAYVLGKVKDVPHSRIQEIEELSQSVERQIKTLNELAYLDSLTQVQNRRSIEHSLDLAIASAKRDNKVFSIALIDLDNFKTINDTYGHDAGDLLLLKMVERIKRHLREVDQIGRLGGDEFLIIFHNDVHPENIIHALKRIRKLFEEPLVINGIAMVSTLSIGVVTYPDGGRNKQELLKCADEAMYRVKRQGGNGIIEEHMAMAAVSL
jgi:diguanylate cyclase (GGDEF)-like protein